MLLSAVVLCFLFLEVSAQNPSMEGFISIDCGIGMGRKYTDTDDGISYVADEPYASTGVNSRVSPETNLTTWKSYYTTLRSFPEGARNCYTLGPVKAGSKYRVKGEFLYGNYDGLGRPPTFDLYLGVNLWKTMEYKEYQRAEMVFLARGESVQVCLVNTGGGVPFVSQLDLRPVAGSVYTQVETSLALLVNWDRKNFGATEQIRFPQDSYDRGWYPWIGGTPISNNNAVSPVSNFKYVAPPVVLQTAATRSSVSENFEIITSGTPDESTVFVMYFAELLQLPVKGIREFNIYTGDKLLIGPIRPSYLQETVVYWDSPALTGGLTFSLRATTNSTHPPLINALETLVLRPLPLLPTNKSEVEAMQGLKTFYSVNKNWQGDPCLPQKLIWEGVGCILDSSNYSRISTLNLSQGSLSGQIPSFIANLTSLTSLDMSYNNITGEIPSFLVLLPALKFLNLEGNNLTGDIPQALLSRSRKGELELRVSNNPILCSRVNLCDVTTEVAKAKKKKFIVPVVVAGSAAVLLFLVILLIVCTFNRRNTKKKKNVAEVAEVAEGTLERMEPRENPPTSLSNNENVFHSQSHLFSLSDIKNITNNFQRSIGRGAFGIVYYGLLRDGIQVAVKVPSQISAHGVRQFRAEAKLLTRVHHKHLVSLLGYCKENLALVYEFVALGSLSDHLSGNSTDGNFLSWGSRLRIALEAAQGLDYLHNGCKLPVLHRDVKTSNILLNESFEAKLADFGLSRSFQQNDGNTHLSTVLAGTPGYMDPECFQTNRINTKSDVYSFGVVMLELITGKPPITFNGNRTHITQEVQAKLERGDIASIVDQRLQGQYNVNLAWKFIEISLACTSVYSRNRPPINDVVMQLKECQALERSRETSSGVGSDSIYFTPHSVKNISPGPR
ncbi:putative LRR receptor-like serine/threonine-protein kinase At1g05700 isoform X2 [Wolffia australiana]